VQTFLDDAEHYQRVAHSVNPYGDGHATTRIISALTGRQFSEFDPPIPAIRPTIG